MESSNVYTMLLLIILSLLEGFYSPKTQNFVGSSSGPPTKKKEAIPPHIKKKREVCKDELAPYFSKDRKSEEHIKSAIINLTLRLPLPNFVEKYFKTFYPYIVQDEVPCVIKLCTSHRGIERTLCYEPIMHFFFNEPKGLLYNVVYNITRDSAKATGNAFIKQYFELVVEGLGINIKPKNVTPLPRPYKFCNLVDEEPTNDPMNDPPNDPNDQNELEVDLELRLGHNS